LGENLIKHRNPVGLPVDLDVTLLDCELTLLTIEGLGFPEFRYGSGDSLDDITLFYSL
jgi:hypothetical protein